MKADMQTMKDITWKTAFAANCNFTVSAIDGRCSNIAEELKRPLSRQSLDHRRGSPQQNKNNTKRFTNARLSREFSESPEACMQGSSNYPEADQVLMEGCQIHT